MKIRKKATVQTHVEEESLLNLTPLIDVVFVVLIIFILIAPMLETDKIDLATGAKDNKEVIAPESSPITLYVKEDNSIWIHQKKVTPEELYSILVKERANHPNKAPQLFHDKKAQFGTYQTVKNTLEMAGFKELDLVLQPGSP
jgi:biopolymer transport protein ExbD